MVAEFVRYPQVLINVPVASSRPFKDVERIVAERNSVEAELAGKAASGFAIRAPKTRPSDDRR